MTKPGQIVRGLMGSVGMQMPRRFALTVIIIVVCATLLPSSMALSAGGANRDSCPPATESSPGFRAYLPDCRAYELVTPSFTGGFGSSFPVPPPLAADYSSNRFLFGSFGTFADAPATSESPVLQTLYSAERITGGWQSSSLIPPLNFQIHVPTVNNAKSAVIPDADNRTFAWLLRDRSMEGSRASVYLREDAGPLELIGPVTPKAGAAAGEETPILADSAAADLSRILLRAKVPSSGVDPWLWPGDKTLKNGDTLYEYDRSEPNIGAETSEPKLVGVKNEGRLLSNSEAQPISQCGIVLGGGYTPPRIIGAISDDGKYVHFTAQKKAIGNGATQCPAPAPTQPISSEVYARVEGEQTVAISNPSTADCTACLNESTTPTRKAAETKVANLQAVYQGASADGTKVFFTSFQELFPGIFATGFTPNLYRYDFEAPAGERLELVSEVPSGSAEVAPPPASYTGISTDGERIYFIAKKVLASNESQAYDPITKGFQKAESGKFNFYVWNAPSEGNQANIRFIAQMPSGTLNPVTTQDGRFAIFTTTAQLVESNASTVAQLFLYDADSEALVRVSVGDQGFNNNGNTALNPPSFGGIEPALISDDGRRVFFMSSNALTSGALNDPTDQFKNIYEWTWTGSHPTEASARVFLILSAAATNGGSSARAGRLRGIDPMGNNVFFTTGAKLVPQHASGQSGIYTARVEGGLPGLPDEAICEGDSCQGFPALPQESTTLASAFIKGVGNASGSRKARSRRCQRGERRKFRKGSRRCKSTTRQQGKHKTNRGAGR